MGALSALDPGSHRVCEWQGQNLKPGLSFARPVLLTLMLSSFTIHVALQTLSHLIPIKLFLSADKEGGS